MKVTILFTICPSVQRKKILVVSQGKKNSNFSSPCDFHNEKKNQFVFFCDVHKYNLLLLNLSNTRFLLAVKSHRAYQLELYDYNYTIQGGRIYIFTKPP